MLSEYGNYLYDKYLKLETYETEHTPWTYCSYILEREDIICDIESATGVILLEFADPIETVEYWKTFSDDYFGFNLNDILCNLKKCFI